MVRKNFTRIAQAGLVAMVFAAAMAIGFFVISSNAQAKASWTGYKVNDDGLTYGMMLEAPEGHEMPDLVGVIATNGERGYVYWSEMDSASYKPATLEDAGKYMEEYNARRSFLFVKFLSEELGIVIDTSTANAYEALTSAEVFLFNTNSEPGAEWTPDDEARSKLIEALGLEEPGFLEGLELGRVLARVFINIQSADAIEIPVYKEDGKTQIGVFLIPV